MVDKTEDSRLGNTSNSIASSESQTDRPKKARQQRHINEQRNTSPPPHEEADDCSGQASLLTHAEKEKHRRQRKKINPFRNLYLTQDRYLYQYDPPEKPLILSSTPYLETKVNLANLPEKVQHVILCKTYQKVLEDSWKTLRRLPKKFSNAFYARRRSTKSIKVFCPKWYKYWIYLSQILENFSEDSWKTSWKVF
ncbi:hypothetical protein YC2023_044812 [Brassica napus]